MVVFSEKSKEQEIFSNDDSKDFGEKTQGKNLWEIKDEKNFIGLVHTITPKDVQEQLKWMKEKR